MFLHGFDAPLIIFLAVCIVVALFFGGVLVSEEERVGWPLSIAGVILMSVMIWILYTSSKTSWASPDLDRLERGGVYKTLWQELEPDSLRFVVRNTLTGGTQHFVVPVDQIFVDGYENHIIPKCFKWGGETHDGRPIAWPLFERDCAIK